MPLIVVTAVVCLAVAAAVVTVRVRVRVVTVHGPSMEPAVSDRDRLIVRRTGLDAVHSGQLVVVANPQDDHDGKWMVKRAVALPGEPVPAELRTAVPDETVPDRHFLVLGDNPAVSADSRHLGYLRGDQLLGVVVRKISPRAVAGGAGAVQRRLSTVGRLSTTSATHTRARRPVSTDLRVIAYLVCDSVRGTGGTQGTLSFYPADSVSWGVRETRPSFRRRSISAIIRGTNSRAAAMNRAFSSQRPSATST